MAQNKPNNVIRIPCGINGLFHYWLEFLSPFHHLTEREQDVAAAFLKERFRLQRVILDEDLLDRTLMSEESQRDIRESCNLTNQHFQVIKSKLKSKHFLDPNNKINSKLIPNIKEENGIFQLLLLFDVKGNAENNQ